MSSFDATTHPFSSDFAMIVSLSFCVFNCAIDISDSLPGQFFHGLAHGLNEAAQSVRRQALQTGSFFWK